MRKQLTIVETPVSANERFLFAMCERLDRIIELIEDKFPDVKYSPTVVPIAETVEEIKQEAIQEVKKTTRRKTKDGV